MGKELRDRVVHEVTAEILRLSEELVDQVLYGDIEKAPWSLVIDKIDLNKVSHRDAEAYLRVCVAATIRQKFGGPKHAAR